MTLREIGKKEFGNKGYEKLSTKLKQFLKKVDSLPVPNRAIVAHQLKIAFK